MSKLGSVRILTKEYINQVTQNYSHQLGSAGKVYRGTLEDNMLVAVKKFKGISENLKQKLINEATNLSQMDHKNVIKILGCCIEDDTLIFVYEYAAKGTLHNIMYGGQRQEFPLDVRVKIAVKTAEALECLHSSATFIIIHGAIAPSHILLDNNFMPKLTGFSWESRRIRETEITTGGSQHNQNQIHYKEVVRLVRVDVCQIGLLLFLLITRKYFHEEDLIKTMTEFKEAYKRENTGRAFFDKDITDEEDITILDEIGRLVLKLVWIEDEPPTMKEVVKCLRVIRSHVRV